MWSAAIAADFHLQARDPAGLENAIRLLRACESSTRKLYLLGDVFDFWTSRALLSMPELQGFFDALRAASSRGLQMCFLPGNRDFNLDRATGREIGLEVCGEHLSVDVDGRRVLLTHGDCFLLEDHAYQRLKKVIRSAPMRLLARHTPTWLALAVARRLRRYSDEVVPRKRSHQLQIVESAVRERFTEGHQWVICGHVHHAERRDLEARGSLFVLPAFQESGEFAVLDGGGISLRTVDGSSRPFPVEGTGQREGEAALAIPSVMAYPDTRGLDGKMEERLACQIVTIDGPAGVGKSSVARKVAAALGFVNLNTGAMYRAVTLAGLRVGLVGDAIDVAGIERLVPGLRLRFGPNEELILDGEDVTALLSTDPVNQNVSAVSALRSVREAMVRLQRDMAGQILRSGRGLVIEGRDTGSFVFPDARHRFYLDATLEERARRRFEQSGQRLSMGQWIEHLRERDRKDSERDLAPLCIPDGAVVIDTSRLSEESVVKLIFNRVRSKEVGRSSVES